LTLAKNRLATPALSWTRWGFFNNLLVRLAVGREEKVQVLERETLGEFLFA